MNQMNPSEQVFYNKISKWTIAFLLLCMVILCLKLFYDKQYSYGIAGIVVFTSVIIVLLWKIRAVRPLPIDVVVNDYCEYLEDKFKISIKTNPPQIYWNECNEQASKYRIVLFDDDEYAKRRYYPFEADLYERMRFGSSAGQVFESVNQAQFWISQNKPSNINKSIFDIIEQQVNKKMQESLSKIPNMKGGEDEQDIRKSEDFTNP